MTRTRKDDTLQIRIPHNEKTFLARVAQQRGMTLSDLLRTGVTEFVRSAA